MRYIYIYNSDCRQSRFSFIQKTCFKFFGKCTAILNVDSKYIFYGQQKLKSRHTFSKYGQ